MSEDEHRAMKPKARTNRPIRKERDFTVFLLRRCVTDVATRLVTLDQPLVQKRNATVIREVPILKASLAGVGSHGGGMRPMREVTSPCDVGHRTFCSGL